MKRILSFLALALLSATLASAQETTGDVVGTIVSQDGQALPGVTVTLTHPATGLTRAAVTGAEGRYRFPALPPASYALTATLQGFRTYQAPVAVALGQTVCHDVEMAVGAFEDVVEVTAQPPQLDPASTVAGITVDTDDLLGRLPVQREITEIALLAPGTLPADNYWQEAFNTGLYTPGQGFISFSGSSFGENSYLVNGLNITNFRNFMGSSFVPLEFVDELQVKTGGYQAEFGRSTGGVLNIVTKSGTNTFHGDISVYGEPESFQGREPDTLWSLNQQERRKNVEINVSLGGPILSDRLFFFGFVRYSDSSNTDVYPGVTDLNESSAPYWGGKLDWYLSPGHRLEGTYLSDKVDVHFTRTWDDDRENPGRGVRRRGGDNYVLKYTGLLTSSVLLSAQAGRNEFDRTNVSDGDECPWAIDYRGEVAMPVGCWVRSIRGADRDTREAYRLDIDWFRGTHSVRAGADNELNNSLAAEEYSGGMLWVYFLNGSPDQSPESYRYPWLPWDQNLAFQAIQLNGGSYDLNSNAAYVQDSWSVTPNLTLNLGVRWERYENKNALGQTFIETNDQWAPRLGAIWDPTGTGRSKLYASFGKYHLPVSGQASIWLAGAYYYSEAWYAFDGNLAADGSPAMLGNLLEQIVYADGETPDPRESLSDNLEPAAQNEVIVGYERRLGSDWTIGVRGVARWYDEVIEDFTIYKGLWNTYGVDCLDPDLLGTPYYCWDGGWRLGNPGRDFEGWYDLDGDGELDRVFIPADDLGIPPAERKYYALELTFSRRFSEGWMLRGSYTWSHLYGNYEGTISDEWFNDLAGAQIAFDWPYEMEYSTGDLPNDMRHNLKLYGSYSWAFGLQTGAAFSYYTGRPINSYGRHPNDPWAAETSEPAFYTGGEPRPRGCCGRTEDVWGLDVMLKYDFEALGIDWIARLDVFNVFNTHNVVRVDERAERFSNGAPRATYRKPMYYQPPRTVRLGFGISF